MVKKLTIVVILFPALSLGADSSHPVPITTLDLSIRWPGSASVQLAFISEDTIALIRDAADPVSSAVITVDWRSQKLQPIKWKPVSVYGFRSLHGVSNGLILLDAAPKPQLMSRDLETLAEMPMGVVTAPASRGSLAGEWLSQRQWRLYRLGPPVSLVRSGDGEILSVSDDFVVIRSESVLRVERTSDGTTAGAFAVASRLACAGRVTVLGPGRLLMTDCRDDQVIDFQGKRLVTLPRRDGWGFRHGVSADGSRAVFDDFTRRIQVIQRISEFVESVLTFGMSPNIESIGEEVRVVDTNSGKVCFDLDSPDRQFGRAGEYHADVSPSGRYVAVVDGSNLSVYTLPGSCTR